MGTISIIICGLIGACSACKQSFLANWIFLVNFSIALYTAIFLAPLAVALLEVPGLPEGIKIAASVGVTALVLFFILKKVAEQVFPDFGNALQLPSLLEKISSVCSGMLSGFLVGGLILYIIVQLPLGGLIPGPMMQNFRSSSSNTMLSLIGTVNVFSCQSLTSAGTDDLRTIGLLPKPEPPAGKPTEPGKQSEAKAEEADEQSARQQGEKSAESDE